MVRRMQEADLVEARRIFRVAFGTFLGLPEPESFAADCEYIFTRWRAAPEAALVAEREGVLEGSNFLAQWGSFGFFGPLTVRPDLWGRGVAQELLARTVEMFDEWGLRDSALFTFSNSAKHVGLYQKFGYWPRFLTALMSREVTASGVGALKFAGDLLGECRELTDSIYEGLDLSSEIQSVASQALGETLLVWEGDRLDGLAVCHCGPGTEAGAGNCYIKFACARTETALAQLMSGCEALAAELGLKRIETGCNLSRVAAYGAMMRLGFRTERLGVAMHRGNSPAYNVAESLVLDDWR